MIVKGNRDQLEGTLEKGMPDKITIDLNVFGPLVEDIIASNLNSTPIVTIDRSSRRSRHLNLVVTIAIRGVQMWYQYGHDIQPLY
jgi:hypothetical protein